MSPPRMQNTVVAKAGGLRPTQAGARDAANQFRGAIVCHGLPAPDRIEPGRFVRFPGREKSGNNKAAWCVLFDDLRGGAFGDFSTNLECTWQASDVPAYTDAERQAHQAKVQALKAQREAEETASRKADADKAALRWQNAAQPVSHPYLTRKGIQAYGIRQDGPTLLIPLRDAAGHLHSLQTIAPNGDKRFKGRVKGCYHAIGGQVTNKLVIAEGYATGATIHAATGHPVAVAFMAHNVGLVAAALRKKYRHAVLVMAADDDHRTPGNPGLTAAKQAALAVGGFVVVPQFPSGRQQQHTDFNDLAALAGPAAVRACFDEIEGVL